MSSSTFTAFIRFPVLSPDWRTTVEALAHLGNLCYTEFINERIVHQNIYLFEVFGRTEDVEWFRGKLLAEDRKRQYIKYMDQVELTK